jgi:hypothetical protein
MEADRAQTHPKRQKPRWSKGAELLRRETKEKNWERKTDQRRSRCED